MKPDVESRNKSLQEPKVEEIPSFISPEEAEFYGAMNAFNINKVPIDDFKRYSEQIYDLIRFLKFWGFLRGDYDGEKLVNIMKHYALKSAIEELEGLFHENDSEHVQD